MGNREFKGGPEGELHFSEEELSELKQELDAHSVPGTAHRSNKLHIRSDMEVGIEDTLPARRRPRTTGTIPLTLLPKRPPADTANVAPPPGSAPLEPTPTPPPIEPTPTPAPIEPAPTPAPIVPTPTPTPPVKQDLSKTMLGFGPDVMPTAPTPAPEPPAPTMVPAPAPTEVPPADEPEPPAPAQEPDDVSVPAADEPAQAAAAPVEILDDLADDLSDPEDAPTVPSMSAAVGDLFARLPPVSVPDDLFDTQPGDAEPDDRDPIERLVSAEIVLDIDTPEEPEEEARPEVRPEDIEPEDIETASGDPLDLPPSVAELDPEDLPTTLMLSDQRESRELVKGILAEVPGLPDPDEDDTLELSPETVQQALESARKAAAEQAEAEAAIPAAPEEGDEEPPPAPEDSDEEEAPDEHAGEPGEEPPEATADEEADEPPEPEPDDDIADWAAEDQPTDLSVAPELDAEEGDEAAVPAEPDEEIAAATVEPEEEESGEVALESDDLEEMPEDADDEPASSSRITLDEEAPEDDPGGEEAPGEDEPVMPALVEPEEELSMPALPEMAELLSPPEVEVTSAPEVPEDEVAEVSPDEVGLTEVSEDEDEDEVEELSPDDIGLQEVLTPLPQFHSPFDNVADEPDNVLRIPVGEPVDDDIMTSAPVIDSPPPSPSPRPVPPEEPAAREGARPTPQRHVQVGGQRKRPWYADVFDEDWYRISPLPPPAQVKREILFLEESLKPTPDSQMLELGCGAGQHVIEMARKGYKVTGFDMSLQLLIQAGELAQREGLQVDFLQGDFKDIGVEERFDAVYSIHSRFGYFNDDRNRQAIESVNRSLKKGGRFLLDVVNRDYCLRDLPARVWREAAGCLVLEEVEFEYFTSRIVSKRTVVFEDGRHLEQEISVRVYSLHEVGNLLHKAGFRVLQVSGNLAHPGIFFGNHSRSLMFLAEKKGR